MDDSAEVVTKNSFANLKKRDSPKLRIEPRYGYSAASLAGQATLDDGQA